ncbi:MAG: phage tail tape measure protein [Lachnospiraceae bacterium]|nr:phage tail tape measure protein [Lachnospiraceae bacterium]
MSENSTESITSKALLDSGKKILLGLNKISDSLSELKKLDAQLTQISRSTQMTSTQLKALGDRSFSTASQYGKSASDYLSAVQDMSSRGYSGKKSSSLAETSLLAQSAGNMSADTAGDYLAAVDAAYRYAGSVEKLTSVLDGQQNIAIRNRIAMTDMATATSIAAQSAADSGVKINELSALIATDLSNTKKDGEEVGATLNTLFTSLQNPGNIQVTNPFDSLLKGQGNYEQLLQDYANGSGSAMEAVRLQSSSLEGSLNQLAKTWNSTLRNTNSSINTDTKDQVTSFLTDVADVILDLSEVSNPVVEKVVRKVVSTGIELVVTAIDNYIHRVEIAKEKISEFRSEYEDAKSELSSMNSELEDTSKKISELESKGHLTFTEESELDNLKTQNDELERNIKLQEKKTKNKSSQTVDEIKLNQKDLFHDFDRAITKYTGFRYEEFGYEHYKTGGLQAVKDGTYPQEYYEKTMADMDKTLKDYEGDIIDRIEEFEDYKNAIANMYGTTDSSKYELSDQKLYADINRQLQKAYKTVYTDFEYNKFIIEPILEENNLKGLQDKLLNYFLNGGKTDLSSLESKFGSDIITSLRNACENSGIDFNTMIEDIYENSQDKIDKIAPMAEIPDNPFDARQNANSKAIRDYIQNEMSEEDRTILFTAEIPDDVKFETAQDVIDFVNSLHEQLPIKDQIQFFPDAWDSISQSGSDEHKKSVQEAKEKLLELAEAGRLTVEAFEKSPIAAELEETGFSAEKATEEINKMADSAKQLSSMRTGITAITSAYDEKKNSKNKVVSAPTIESMGDTLGVEAWSPKDQKVWENYKNIAGDGTKSLKQFKSAQDKLATSFIHSNNFLANITDETKDYYIGLLEEMGITNAAAVATDTLNQKKAEAKMATFDISTATEDEINSLGNYVTSLDGAGKQLAWYVLKQQIASNNALDTTTSVAQLRTLAEQCGITGEAMQWLAYLEANQAKLDELKAKGGGNGEEWQNTLDEIEHYQNLITKAVNKKANVKPDTAPGNPGNNPPAGNGKNQGTKETKQEIDWIARRLEVLSKRADYTKAKLENLFKFNARQTNLDKQIKQSTKLMNAYGKAAEKYKKKASNVKLSDDLKKKVDNGQISGKLSELIATYGETDAKNIQKYKDYQDKYQENRLKKVEQRTNTRELKQQKRQEAVDLYDARVARAEAKESVAIGYKEKNTAVKTQIRNTKLSYKNQIKLAKNKAEAEKLEYELQKKVAELKLKQIQNIQQHYENQMGLIDNNIQDIDNRISLAQARGQIITAGYYRELNSQQADKREKASTEKAKIQQKLDAAVKKGTIKEGSDEWYEVQATLQELENTINECDIAIAENTTSIREVHTALLEAKAQNASRINTEADFLAELLSRNELTDSDTGTLTNAGLGTLGTYGINLETAQSQIREWNKERAILESMKKSGSLDYGDGVHKYDSPNQLDDAYKAIIEKQQEWAKNEFDAEQKIIDLMKEKYQAQLDYMKEIIDAKKKALDYEKDLYDYQKNIAEKTKNIATLEKQLAALQGDNSEEGRARRTQLQLSLDEANQDLQDTEYDKYISDQQNMLDNLYAEYEDLMNNLFKNTDALLQKGIEAINNNASLIQGILDKTAKDYGYDYSDNFSEIMGAFKNGGVVTSIKESLYNDKSSIASILNKQNEYLETKYGENNSPSQSQQNVDLATASGDYGSNATENGYISDTGNSVANGKTYDSVDNSDVYEYNQALNDALKSMIGEGYQYLWNFSGNTPSSYVNKSLIKNKIYPYKKNGKTKYAYLSKDGLQVLAEKLGVNFPAKEGNATAELKAYFEKAGFHTGGIIRATGVPSDGDYVPIRVNPNETVLTQDFTKMLPSAVDIMARFVDAQTIPNYNLLPPNISGSQSFGDVVFHAELPNVKNAQDFVDALQNDTRVRKAFTVATKDLISKGRITSNIQSVN